MSKYQEPTFVDGVLQSSFNCPTCDAFALQRWFKGFRQNMYGEKYEEVSGLNFTYCDACDSNIVWLDGTPLSPPTAISAPAPNPDLPESVLASYQEARSIVGQSPRAAAALLRLAIQELVKELDKSDNLNTAIGELVKDGLPEKIQRALDVVRVVGNNAVHPGTIDFSDGQDVSRSLFGLVNLIADKMITEPKEIERLYGQLPHTVHSQIERRDNIDGGEA